MSNAEGRTAKREWRIPPPLALILLLSASVCGKVADPQPPITAPAPPLAALQLIAEGGLQASVEFVPPPRLERVQLLRLCEGQTEGELLTDVSAASLRRGVTEGTRRIDDPRGLPETRCEYRLLYQAGRRPGQSPALSWEPSAAAEPPSLLEPVVTPDGVELRWQPPARNTDGSLPAKIEGYLVNGTIVVTDPEYIDRNVEWGRQRSYSVQTISRRQSPLVLSRPSEPKRVTPLDRFPPDAPANVIAVSDGDRIQVVWDPSPSADVAGYLVYHGSGPEQLQKASPLLTITRYTDEAPPAGPTVYYQVTAVDGRGNESKPSEHVRVHRRSN